MGVEVSRTTIQATLPPPIIRPQEEVAGRQTAAVSIALWDSHAEILVYP